MRPSYALGGRAMRVCHTEEQVVEAFHGVHGPTLVDRFLEYAIEIDVDALDGESTYVGAIMQHVEEAGVHSGDFCLRAAGRSRSESSLSRRSPRSSSGSGRRWEWWGSGR